MRKSITLLFFAGLISSAVFAQIRSAKRGIAYGSQTEADMAVVSKGVSWWYNWDFQPESDLIAVYEKYNMDFVPMAWGKGFNEAGLRAYYSSHPNAKYLLAFNEPNFIAQSNLKPSEVAALWPSLEKIASDFGLKIVGPAVNYCDKCVSEGGVTFSDPVAYLDAFFAACPNCQVDYVAVHNYMCYSGALSDYVGRFKKYNKPIWLTEFACWDQATITLDMQKSLVLGALDYLEGDSSVFRYSWFTGDRSGAYPYINLFDAQSGVLSDLGDLYVNYNPIHDHNAYTQVPARIEAESYSSMYGIALEATKDVDGTADVGWIDAGDWMDYNIDVPASGNYYIYLRVACNSNTTIELKENSNSLKIVQIPASGGWQNWETVSASVFLSQGKQTLRVFAPSGGFNLNWIYVSDHEKTVPQVNAGNDVTITLPNNTVSLNGTATGAIGDELTYQWTKTSGADPVVINSANSSSASVSALLAGLYTFKLTVSNGVDFASDLINVNVLDPTGISTESNYAYKVYPNPVVDMLYFEFGYNLPLTNISITDQLGKEIFHETIIAGSQQYHIDMSNYGKGVYLVKIKNSVRVMGKLIIK